MKRLHIYVIKTFLGPFVMTFFICLFVLLMQFLWKYVDDLVGKGLDWSIIGEIVFYAAFGLLPMVFPLSMLIASIMTFGALGENYELVAIKSSGISLFRIMRPLIIMAFLLSCTAFYFANYVLPETNRRLFALMMSVKEQKPELILKEGVFTNEIDGYSIKIGRKNRKTNVLHDILIYDQTDRRYYYNVTLADSGFLKMTEDKKYMVMTLFNGVNYRMEKQRTGLNTNTFPHYENKFGNEILRIGLKDFQFNRLDESLFHNNYRMLRLDQLKAAEDSMETEYLARVRSLILQIGLNMTLRDHLLNLTQPYDSLRRYINDVPDTLVDVNQLFAGFDKFRQQSILETALERTRGNHQLINNRVRFLYERKSTINRHEMERHKKFTLSVAVLIFFFIGAPLGAIIRKGGLGMPVVVSILLFILYYIISMMGEKSAREDLWNMVVGMWFSSAIFVAVGGWLTYKAVTDSGIMMTETYTNLLKKLNILRLFKRNQISDEDTSDNQ